MAKNYCFDVSWYHGEKDFVIVVPVSDVKGAQFRELRSYLIKPIPLKVEAGNIASFSLEQRAKQDKMVEKVFGTAVSYIESDLINRARIEPVTKYHVVVEGNSSNSNLRHPRTTKARERNHRKKIPEH